LGWQQGARLPRLFCAAGAVRAAPPKRVGGGHLRVVRAGLAGGLGARPIGAAGPVDRHAAERARGKHRRIGQVAAGVACLVLKVQVCLFERQVFLWGRVHAILGATSHVLGHAAPLRSAATYWLTYRHGASIRARSVQQPGIEHQTAALHERHRSG